MNLKFSEKKTTKTENKASTFGVSEEKTVNKRASLLREGDRIAVEGVRKPLTNFLHGIT